MALALCIHAQEAETPEIQALLAKITNADEELEEYKCHELWDK